MANCISKSDESAGVGLNAKMTILLAEKSSMGFWLEDLIRFMRMGSSLLEFRKITHPVEMTNIFKYIEANREGMFQKLDSIHFRLKRAREKSRSSFFALFSLVDQFIENESVLWLDKSVQVRFVNIMYDLLDSASFRNSDPKNLVDYLYSFYEVPERTMPALLEKWRSTKYFYRPRPLIIPSQAVDPKIINLCYFSVLIYWTEKILVKNIDFLPTFNDLGQYHIKLFSDFLEKYQIPYSGPYKKSISSENPKLIFYVASCKKQDRLYNGNVPFHGAFSFEIEKLRLRNDLALNYVGHLPLMPDWLMTNAPGQI